jgi:quercetin dioxygenase-like cupin family protein
MSTSTTTGIIRQAGEGEQRWFSGGGLHTWKVRAAETAGSFSVFEDRMTQGKLTPWHCHPTNDEMVYVLEGELLVRHGDREELVGPGGLAMAPRGAPHALMVTSDTARVLVVLSPGNAEDFYRGASDVATSDAEGETDFDRVHDLAQRTGITEILGPPPFDLA